MNLQDIVNKIAKIIEQQIQVECLVSSNKKEIVITYQLPKNFDKESFQSNMYRLFCTVFKTQDILLSGHRIRF